MKYPFTAGIAYLLLLLWLGISSCTTDTSIPEPEPKVSNATADSTAETGKGKAGISEDYTHTDRVIWQKPNMVIDLLGDISHKTIADIGAGTGFFSLRLTPKAKKVIAIDIDPRFVNYLDSIRYLQLPEPLQDRLETRLATPTDPLLKAEEVDVAIIVNTVVYIRDRVAYLSNLKNGISANGQLLIIDFKKKRTPVGPPQTLKVPAFQIEEELYRAGYREVLVNDTALDYQYLIIARK
mgnify:CR=1 FL=1